MTNKLLKLFKPAKESNEGGYVSRIGPLMDEASSAAYGNATKESAWEAAYLCESKKS